MSADDLSPMLSQPTDDNAPMISGRGTKIIADARGAYVTGNIRAIIDKMDEAKKLRFRQAVIGQLAAQIRSVYGASGVLIEMLIIIDDWVSDPTVERTDDIVLVMQELYQQPEFEARRRHGEDYTVFRWLTTPVYECAQLIQAPSLIAVSQAIAAIYANLARVVIPIARNETDESIKESRRKMYRWEVEAAWAIWQSRELPPFDLLPPLTDETRKRVPFYGRIQDRRR